MRETFVTGAGLNLCVCRWGPIEAPAILILHGWLDQAAAWGKVAEYLVEQGYQVIAPDHRGHGRSDHVPTHSHYHFPDYVADLQKLIQQLDLTSFHLIGHSMGGTIASLYAGLVAEGIEQMVLIEGLGPVHESPTSYANRYAAHLKQRTINRPHKRKLSSPEDAAKRLQQLHSGLTKEIALKLAARILTPDDKGWRWCWDPRHRDKAAIGFDMHRHLTILGRIQVPTHLIFGKQSWYPHLSDLEERISALAHPGMRVEIETGHSPHYTMPKNLAEILLQCFVRNPNPPKTHNAGGTLR